MANEEIRFKMKEAGFTLHEVAEYLRIADSTFSRQLRRDLPKYKGQFILKAIERMAEFKAEREAKEASYREERNAWYDARCK